MSEQLDRESGVSSTRLKPSEHIQVQTKNQTDRQKDIHTFHPPYHNLAHHEEYTSSFSLQTLVPQIPNTLQPSHTQATNVARWWSRA